ncbi:hypothetical protein SAMN05216480_102157 [Pustulibacterium marinum]|uniref:peptidylprolyl isomerase n=1 Tax=Pustulibacterium marinum TaxID=1224947 RepID=A0A1I7FRG7_9FLAO|nr:hypothetical protein [Pustulibacterium marinum]SFU38809.1 hypothetical protein SAMN05216480_102157 [Pustulibacterium marinum]
MKLNRISIFSFFVATAFVAISCKNDDDVSIEPPRDVTEVMLEDDEELQEFLATHFYNYEEFETPSEDFNYKIVFDTISGDNANKTALLDQVQDTTVYIDDADGEAVAHKLYYLTVREGIGERPHSCDSVFVRYTGSSLKGVDFDNSNVPVWFDLLSTVRGFSEFFPKLKTGVYEGLQSGVPTYSDYGIGAVFMPSGLAYFSDALTGVSAYSPLIFRADLLSYELADHDGDLVPSYLEYRDEDGEVLDTDEDGVADVYDTDDDGDGALTKDEIEYEDYNGDGEITFDEVTLTDSNDDGTPDYLDPDVYPEDE